VGLAPGLQSRAVDLSHALKETARGSGGRRSQQVRGLLVVAEVSMAVVLLIGAGLMIRSVVNLVALNPGFNPSSILTLRVNIPRAPRAPAASAPSGQPSAPVAPPPPLTVQARSLPNVYALCRDRWRDLSTTCRSTARFGVVLYRRGSTGRQRPKHPTRVRSRGSPDFFATLAIPIVQGRTFTQEELKPASPAVSSAIRS
jgi:putative ABC transport system permease protein